LYKNTSESNGQRRQSSGRLKPLLTEVDNDSLLASRLPVKRESNRQQRIIGSKTDPKVLLLTHELVIVFLLNNLLNHCEEKF